MHFHSHYLHPTASGHAQAWQVYLATQGYHHGCEPYLLQGDDGTTYAIHPGDWPWSPQPFASGADASAYGTNQAANAQCAPIYSMNPYFPSHAYYQHAVSPAFVQYLPQMPQLYVPPACVAAVSESDRFVTDSYYLAQSVQPPTSCADGLKAPKPKRPDEGVPKIIVEDEVPDIVVEACDSDDAQSPEADSATPATNSSDGTHLHPHWHERTESPSEGSLAPNPSHDSSVTSPSEGPLLYPRIHAIKSISCHCTPRVPLLKDISSSLTSSLASLTAHPSSPTASATPSASLTSTAAGISTASTAPNMSTAPALTARPVSSPPVMTAVVVPMFPFSPLVPKVSLGSLRMPARSFKERLPLGLIPGVLSPWVVDGRGLSLQPLPAEGARGDSKLTLDSEPLPPYSPAPSMGSATSHWDGERLVLADQGGQRLAGDPWGHEEAVRRWVEELDEFCRTERCATKARWPTLAEVSKVKGDEAAKANDAANAKVDHAETVQLDDHTDLLDRIAWPILRDPDSHGTTNTSQVKLLDLARSVTALSVNLFFRAARQVMLDDHTAWPATLEDRAASRDTLNDCAWRALLRKSHRAFRRAREVVEERLREAGRIVKNVKEVHWTDEVKGAKVDSAGDDEVVVYMTGDDKRGESAKDGRDDDEEQNLRRQNLEDARPQMLENTLRAINVVLQTLDVLRRLDGY
ncbi:hypothetical protein GGF50DRAFT_91409 [Schizophyllum commune]